jgi:hypothetical protein
VGCREHARRGGTDFNRDGVRQGIWSKAPEEETLASRAGFPETVTVTPPSSAGSTAPAALTGFGHDSARLSRASDPEATLPEAHDGF